MLTTGLHRAENGDYGSGWPTAFAAGRGRVLWAGCHFSSKAQRRMQVLCCKVGCRWGQAQLPPHAPGTLPNAQPTWHSSGDVGEKGKNHLWMTKDHTESWPEKGKGWL